MTGLRRPAANPRGVLSRCQARVLALSAGGYTREDIAEVLGVSDETVKSQRHAIYRKLGARNLAHAIAIGYTNEHLRPELLEQVEDYVAERRLTLERG